jgi:hypothetical protein
VDTIPFDELDRAALKQAAEALDNYARKSDESDEVRDEVMELTARLEEIAGRGKDDVFL